MTDAEIYVGLTQLFREMFADDDIVLTPATTAKDIDGWDSFNHLNLIVATETRFGLHQEAYLAPGVGRSRESLSDSSWQL